MSKISFSILFILLPGLVVDSVFAQQAPTAEKIMEESVHHGHTRIDNYNWMRDQENPKVLAYLQAENEYLRQILKPTEQLQEKLYNEMVARTHRSDVSLPYKDNGYFYSKYYQEGLEYPIYLRKKDVENAEDQILLNVNELAAGLEYFDMSNFDLSISPDNRLMAFGCDTAGGWYTLKFKDLSTGKWLEDEIPNTTGDPVWANDNKTVFYSIPDSLDRSYKVKRHILGESYSEDVVVFHEKDQRYDIFAFKSKSKQYIIIRSFSAASIENLVLNADNPSDDFKVFHPREEGLEYYIRHYDNKFYIRTNYKAANYRIMETPIDKTTKENWKEVIPHNPEAIVFRVEVFKDFLALDEMNNGLREINVFDLNTSKSNYITFDEEVYMADIVKRKGLFSEHLNFENDWLRYTYTSLTAPLRVYQYNMRTGEREVIKQSEVPGEYDPGLYESKRLWALTKDNKKVPISLVYKRGLVLDRENPLLLEAYGAYGSYENVHLSTKRLSLLDRGFIFAIAHVRGGAELGSKWYEGGKLLNKKNTFSDFIACAEHLIEEGYTNPNKLFAQGASMGGMLMGAVSNMRPELFKGIIADVPFVDVVTTMFGESNIYEYDELGNPNVEKYYRYILSYSPYDNVQAKAYPSMLVVTGYYDYYWEPAKWVAKLRALKTDSNDLLLYTNMKGDHSGSTGRLERYRQIAMEYAFLLTLSGIVE